MRNIKSQSSWFLILALASSVLAFGLPASSANQQQDPVVTSKQIAALPSSAAPADDRIALYQSLLDLTNPWTVMCVAAHPDDEDGTSLTVMRHKYGAHTVSLFSTYGEGGQNAIGPELYDELGAIRARETKAASEIQGSEPHFLGLQDFGFSKSPVETFEKWGHEGALRLIVLQIRTLRPDVIITNHSVERNDHGHHQATARLIVEAFDAAADPKRFPEQLKDGVSTWQPQRLFVRVFERRDKPLPADGKLVSIDPNERDPVRNSMYAEQALAALQQHATQGPWPKSIAERLRNTATGKLPLIYYHLEREAKGAGPLPNAPQNFLDGLQPPEDVRGLLESLNISGRPLTDFVAEPEKVFAALIPLTQKELAVAALRAHGSQGFKCLGTYGTVVHDLDPKRDLMLERLSLAIRESSGLIAQLIARDGGKIVGGENEPFAVRISNRGTRDVRLGGIAFQSCAVVQQPPWAQDFVKTLAPGQSFDAVMPEVNRLSSLFEQPNGVSAVSAPRRFEKEAIRLDTTIGDTRVLLPVDSDLTFLPDVEITSVSPKTAVLTNGARNARVTFTMQVTNNRSTPFDGRLVANLNSIGTYGSHDAVLTATHISLKPHEKRQFKLDLPQSNVTFKDHAWQGTLDFPYQADFRAQLETRGQPQWINVGRSNEVRVHVAPVSVAPALNVGFIRGFDYSLPDALASLGVKSSELTVDEAKSADLSKFTSIIVDNRVYESKPELIAANQKLLDYANAGGNLIVFYHKNDEWNPDERRNRPQLAPYKLILGGERITDENAPISFLEPDHPLLNTPNKLGQDDFKDWIQERGLYYPKEWDPQFHALLQSNDPGEAPLKGGLLVADYGRGHYIYTSMVWYRELRAGVPGAYRMLANMISYGKGKR